MLLVSEHDRGEPSEEPHTSLSVEKKHSRDDLFGGAGNASVQGTVSWNDVERGPQSMPIGPASGHSYTSPVMNRTGSKKTGCPYCSSRQLLPGFNDLATQYPALARDWDPARNGGLTASEVMPGSVLRWWKCAAGHEQNTMFRNRLRAGGCTACSLEQRVGTAG